MIESIICIVFVLLICITDIKEYKIKNKYILPVIILGLTLGIVKKTFTDNLFGMLLPLILFPLYALKMLGAGDVKALCAIGSVVGLKSSAILLVFTLISGGVIALGFIIFNSNFKERMKYFYNYLKSCIITLSIQKYEFGGNNKSYFRFAYAIAAGTVLMLINRIFPFLTF
ncbi:MAG: prepilin peptidase [Clostridia bacterium]|nr:prepilin peptidase [Clostridia bacterium]